ncbi:hypothetical protein SBA1_340021 [Candidatus Sulfotelmatobacter kueseliae]|uniref:Uncharacterized protein n=1 Tax=Candidatus Sulfotelmatobacter kueseliae TaxID=2042962 RepID=A0A2U3KN48_9BACT|nr:hypothetical protein SBA1_340021 [Candidatus Sulfotelmatobacter kueseliae]
MLNTIWHQNNRMPAKATLAQRIAWHREHQRHCGCREVPKSLKKYFTGKNRRKHCALDSAVTADLKTQ